MPVSGTAIPRERHFAPSDFGCADGASRPASGIELDGVDIDMMEVALRSLILSTDMARSHGDRTVRPLVKSMIPAPRVTRHIRHTPKGGVT